MGCCVTDFVMKHHSLSLKTIFIHLFFWKLPYFSIAHARNFGHVTSLIGHEPCFVCEIKPQPLLTKPSSMEAISQIIRSVGLFVSSSPEVTITKNQPFLCILKNGSIEVPDFVYSLPNCWDVVLLILWWNITVWARKLFLFIFSSENYHILALRMGGISVTWPH